ncbi:hypothetical protein GGI35DRAFT_462088 [Trichoderma velutinum]
MKRNLDAGRLAKGSVRQIQRKRVCNAAAKPHFIPPHLPLLQKSQKKQTEAAAERDREQRQRMGCEGREILMLQRVSSNLPKKRDTRAPEAEKECDH